MGRRKGRRALLILAIVAIVALAVHDIIASPAQSFSARAAIFGIDQYRAHISPHLRGRFFCRFEPTCSAYGREAIRKYGLAVGGGKTAVRIARCGPWTPMGTVDKP